jgi:quercetin dioxygenase-like cupin family protein
MGSRWNREEVYYAWRSKMKVMNIEEIPGRVPPDHYNLIGRTILHSKGARVAFTRMEKTGRCDPHVHEDAEQLFIVLKGEMMFKSGEGEVLGKKGSAVLFYAGEVHSNYNVADGETEYLTITVVTP